MCTCRDCWNGILIGFVVITLILVCFTYYWLYLQLCWILFDAIKTFFQRILLASSLLPQGFKELFLYVRPPTCKLGKRSKRLHSNHGNDDCYTNLYMQRFANTILIGFVVITLCLTCCTFNSAVSLALVVTDFFLMR